MTKKQGNKISAHASSSWAAEDFSGPVQPNDWWEEESEERERVATKTSSVGTAPSMRYAQYTELFMERYVRRRNRPSEVVAKAKMLEFYLIPFFGDQLLHEIGELQVGAFVRDQMQRGYRPKTINNRLGCLRRSLVLAARWGLLDTVPKVQRVTDWVDERKVQGDAEVKTLLSQVHVRYRATVLDAVRAGMRLGEVRARQVLRDQVRRGRARGALDSAAR